MIDAHTYVCDNTLHVSACSPLNTPALSEPPAAPTVTENPVHAGTRHSTRTRAPMDRFQPTF